MMRPEEKMDVLFSKAYLPVFISKLAEAGLEVKHEDDLHELLKMATLIRANVGPVEAQPSETSNLLKRASSRLEAVVSGGASVIDHMLADKDIAQALA